MSVLTLDAAPERRLDLRDRPTRERLTASAIPAVFALARAWGLTDQQVADLLGGQSLSTIRRWRKAAPAEVGIDVLTRVSYLLGIHRALHVLLDEANADAWMTRPNRGPHYAGRTPLDVVLDGGIIAMEQVRRQLDATRGGR